MAKSKKRESPQNVQQPAAADATARTSGQYDRDRVAARAYELYLARGGTHGSDREDWLAAERELLGSSSGAATASSRGKPKK